jgi:uncharacterized membrane protein
MKLEENELTKIQSMLNAFNQLKMQIGDAELAKSAIIKQVETLKDEYAEVEKELAEKYGNDAQIDVKTGEIIEAVETEEVK